MAQSHDQLSVDHRVTQSHAPLFIHCRGHSNMLSCDSHIHSWLWLGDAQGDIFTCRLVFSDAPVTVKHENISGEFLKGSANGGSYKCNAKLTETIGNGVAFETTNLQYKAFNNDNSTSFNSDSEWTF